jgi:transcriptional regulator with XRE-family HTH domain
MIKNKLSIRELADKLKCDGSNLAKIIRGKRQPSSDLVYKIRELVG